MVQQLRAAGVKLILTDLTDEALASAVGAAGEDLFASVAADLSDPADVVAQIVSGVRRNQLHVFPDLYSRLTYYLLRFAPWLVGVLDRRMYEQAVAAGKEQG